jgi:hypothetical protein
MGFGNWNGIQKGKATKEISIIHEGSCSSAFFSRAEGFEERREVDSQGGEALGASDRLGVMHGGQSGVRRVRWRIEQCNNMGDGGWV